MTRCGTQMSRPVSIALLGAFLLAALPLGRAALSERVEPDPRLDSAAGLTLGESRTLSRLDYTMTGKVRLLLWWKGFDDVGGGYIRRGVSRTNPNVRLIEVLFGSDPEKAPRQINRWGAATEAIGEGASAFFGFMTQADPDSIEEAEVDENARNERGEHPFSAILSYVDDREAISRSIPLFAETDYSVHEFDEALRLVTNRLAKYGPVRRLEGKERRCAPTRGFLESVDQLIGVALDGQQTPVSICYVYNARNYTLTLKDVEEVESKTVKVDRRDGTRLETTYRNLVRARFETLNHEDKQSSFELLLGREGSLRGVPVQIVHQPNFWFRVELNLEEAPRGLS